MADPVVLPDWRRVKMDKPRLRDWGGALTPPMGGAVQRIDRLGTRWGIEVTIPVMRTEPDGRKWASLLVQAKLAGALMRFRQDGFRIGQPALAGNPRVNGAGQTGMVLAVDGLRPGYAVRDGQFFSLVSGGRRYLHMATADVLVGPSGAINLPILPMLRISPADNDECEFAQPKIQGELQGNEAAWSRLSAPFTDFGTITILEDE